MGQLANYVLSDVTMETLLQTTMDKLGNWSYGKLQGTFAFTPTLVLPQNEQWYVENGGDWKMLDDARNLAAAYRDTSGTKIYDYTNFDFDAMLFGSNSIGPYCGAAAVGYEFMFMKCFRAGTFLHEFGHCFGLEHANAWVPTSSSPIGEGTHLEYGSPYSVLGRSIFMAGYDTSERYALQWLEPTDVTTVNSSGTYRIYNADTTSLVSGRRYALRIPMGGVGHYFVQFRPNVHPQTSNFVTENGVIISRTAQANNFTNQLLDMNPLTAASVDDSPLIIGRSFHDAGQELTVTPITRSGTGLGDYMDVVVNYTNPAFNSPPVAEPLSANNTSPAVETSITLRANGESDPDGDTLSYSWDFGDGSVSANNSSAQSKSWSAAGNYLVRCTISDGRGKSIVKSILIKVGNPTTYTISGQVKKSDGTPMAGVLILDDSNRPTYTDSEGLYWLTGLSSGSYNIRALRSDFALVAENFTNPVTIGSGNMSGINFTANGVAGAAMHKAWQGSTLTKLLMVRISIRLGLCKPMFRGYPQLSPPFHRL